MSALVMSALEVLCECQKVVACDGCLANARPLGHEAGGHSYSEPLSRAKCLVVIQIGALVPVVNAIKLLPVVAIGPSSGAASQTQDPRGMRREGTARASHYRVPNAWL